MAFNYGLEKKKFDEEWARTAKFYAEQGMSQEAIQQMYEYDWTVFKKERNEALHSQPMVPNTETDMEHSDGPEVLLPRKYLDRFSSEYDTCASHSRYWWLEEIEDPRLIAGLKRLSEEDIYLLTIRFVEGHTQDECADILHISQVAINKRLSVILGKFTKK